jgi:predicted unusual protein kinase regulating ubiquinone biosynthesis (AarF/ABC1/UbiB family)
MTSVLHAAAVKDGECSLSLRPERSDGAGTLGNISVNKRRMVWSWSLLFLWCDAFPTTPAFSPRIRSAATSALFLETSPRTWSQGSQTASYVAHKKMQPMPILGYDPELIMDFYDRRPLEVGWRLNSVGLPLLGWYLGLLSDKALGIDDKDSVQRKRGIELRMHLVRSRSVALIKSGQALSLRPDLIKNKIWADELGKLVDAVGAFPDVSAMNIMVKELADIAPRLKAANIPSTLKKRKGLSKVETIAARDPVLNLFEFYNDNKAVASASIGQVYKARIRRGPQLEAAIGKAEAAKWGGKIVAIKVQRPDAAASASLDMYLLRRAAMWLSKFRGGDLPGIVDQFAMQLFGELDYVREANNCERFRDLYGHWDNVEVPQPCSALTRGKVLVMEWVDGVKGPWPANQGNEMVRTGLKCSVDQLMSSGLFHADPHRGNLLRTPEGKLAMIDFGMMADVSEEERYGLVALVIGIQNKDLPLITENLVKVRSLL